MTSDEVPLMFQAQVEGRCQIQRVVGKGRQQFHDWADEWTKVCSNTTAKPSPSKPLLTKPGQSSSAALMRSPHHALVRPSKNASTLPQKNTASPLPSFGPGVKTKEYEITWRFVSNSGQDEGVIRPIIGAKGFPFYPGASMKGAFLRACTEAEALKYCGGKHNKDTKPGILRFHGAYPVDTNWTKQLVDIIHSQQERQVIQEQGTRANTQISLYQPTLRFGISSRQELDDAEWNTIWTIWEKALAQGIGSRVSAGYGQFKLARENQILQVSLKGQGLTSTLIDGTAEFRPNMFKAVLRGHTLRLFSGFTNEITAQTLTKELWGGFAGRSGAVVGSLGVAFESVNLNTDRRHEYQPKHQLVSMPVYDLERGVLSIISMQPSQSIEQRQALKTLVSALVQFSLLLGGFGKSWRRVDHRLFFPSYLAKGSKPMIGCHWEFIEGSRTLYHPVNEIKDISIFLDSVSHIIRDWITQRNKSVSRSTENWREAWHKAQVWGRFAVDGKDSHAVKWFHGDYFASKSIYQSALTGQMGKIGRIWHRMYPRYISEAGTVKATRGYVELLTIFPDDSTKTQEFIEFLTDKSEFSKLWGAEEQK